MEWLWIALGAAVVLFTVVFVLKNRGKWNRVWMLSLGDYYIRVYPNPGFQLFGVRWSKHWGKRPVYKPKKWGLEPKKLAEEGTPLYDLRMEYYHDPHKYLKERGHIK